MELPEELDFLRRLNAKDKEIETLRRKGEAVVDAAVVRLAGANTAQSFKAWLDALADWNKR